MNQSNQQIKIKKGTGFWEEAYAKWYDCPGCDYSYIMDETKFCGGCGKEIIWEEDSKPNLSIEHAGERK